MATFRMPGTASGKSSPISSMVDGRFAQWVGRAVESDDIVTAAPVRRLAATLSHDGDHWPNGVLPPLGHWLFHLPDSPQSALGIDGHPGKGAFLPPIDQPRRMWAGGRLRFLAPIPFGATLTKRTTIARIEDKGAMIFVTLAHALSVGDAVVIEEEQDLVYLPITPPGAAKPVAVPPPETERPHQADPALLFRFSALTFNAHRIHYDRDYACGVEGYPNLVVQGPLQAMLLIDHAMADDRVPTHFSFRARAPLWAGQAFTTCRSDSRLWVSDASGAITMTAEL